MIVGVHVMQATSLMYGYVIYYDIGILNMQHIIDVQEALGIDHKYAIIYGVT